jgi:hypothetical protein
MKQMKSLFHMSVITSLMIIMFFGSVHGASVTIQREGALQEVQESVVSKNDVRMDGNQPKFTPQRLRDKNDSGRESQTGSASVRMERYKPYQEGEGERKIK